MPIAAFPIGPLDTNCYVACKGKDAIVVDPGGDMTHGLDEVINFLLANALTVRAVVLTHLHFDHIYGVAHFADSGVPVLAGEPDFSMLATSLGRGASFGFPDVRPFTPAPLAEGEISFGEVRVRVLPTPGHTMGGLSLYLPDDATVLAGDTLFCRSIGRTDLAGGDLDTLRRSILTQLFTLPDDTTVCCGHGPNTSIGAEKKHNPYL